MTEQKNLIPKRRFREFQNTHAWEQCKLSDLCSMHARIGWQNLRTSEFLDTGDYYLITGTDFDDGRINFNSCHYVEKERYDQDPKIQIDNGSILITKDGTLGKVAFVEGLDKPATLNAGVFNVKIKSKNIDGKYLYQYLKAPFLMDYISKNATGGTIKHLNQNILVDFPVLLPKVEEQRILGEYFQNLDDLITLHQRKLKKTKELKSAYLSEMFPAEGECEPKRRFAGFTQAWEQRKIGELADIVRGASPRPIQDSKWFDVKSDVGWLRIADVTEQNGRIHYLKQRLSTAGQEKTRVLTKPHLLLSIAATVGKPVVNYVKTGVHDGFLIFQDPLFDREFMFQWLEMFRPKWQRYGQPGSQVNLNSDLVKNQEIRLPSKEEQKKIGDFFAQFDHLIALHQRKLEKLQSMKKAYLTEMFV
ncbi:restriction endonuclease subunit S [Priestia megaterium]